MITIRFSINVIVIQIIIAILKIHFFILLHNRKLIFVTLKTKKKLPGEAASH